MEIDWTQIILGVTTALLGYILGNAGFFYKKTFNEKKAIGETLSKTASKLKSKSDHILLLAQIEPNIAHKRTWHEEIDALSELVGPLKFYRCNKKSSKIVENLLEDLSNPDLEVEESAKLINIAARRVLESNKNSLYR